MGWKRNVRRRLSFRRSRRSARRRGGGRLGKRIRSTIMRMKEKKYLDHNLGKFDLGHNGYGTAFSGFNIDPITGYLPLNGDGRANRDGDQVHVKGVSLKIMFGCKGAHQNTKFRVVAFRHSPDVDASVYSSVFQQVTSNVMLDDLDREMVYKIKDFKVHNQSSTNPPADGDEITFSRKMFLPINKIFTFNLTGSQVYRKPSMKWHIAIMAYDAYGTVPAQIIGWVQLWSRVHFTDI